MEKEKQSMTTDMTKLGEEYANLLQDNQDPKTYFKKKKYSAYFDTYCRQQEEIFSHIKAYWKQLEIEEKTEGLTSAQQALLAQMAQAITAVASRQIEPLKGMKKGNRQSELNLFMVTSVFPCTIKLWPEQGEELCKIIIQEWKKAFPGTELGYADYDKLNEGFRSFWGFLQEGKLDNGIEE